MLKKLAAFAVIALFAMVPLAPRAGAETYAPKLPTVTHVTIVTAVDGQPLEVRLYVTASDGTSPSGQIAYTINSGTGAARTSRVVVARAASSGSVHVSGSAVRVTGQTAHVGTYLAGASFTPDNSAKYLPSSGADRATVGNQVPPGNPSSSSGGGLPNTGGPDLGWLLAGLALIGVGAGTVAYARRRTPAAA